LEREFDGIEGEALCGEMIACDKVESILQMSAQFYTRDTFLYRRVNRFLRAGTGADQETGRNLGLYIGLLRECFCVGQKSSPLAWECPQVVYRGADFGIDVLVDYARRPEELIRWQGFTSSSRDVNVALGFAVNILFEVSLRYSVASLDAISAFKREHEFILSPCQWFSLSCVRWDDTYGRWIVSIAEEGAFRAVTSWIWKAG
jgi:hypothetical protein